jgi:hypothetical protein
LGIQGFPHFGQGQAPPLDGLGMIPSPKAPLNFPALPAFGACGQASIFPPIFGNYQPRIVRQSDLAELVHVFGALVSWGLPSDLYRCGMGHFTAHRCNGLISYGF